MGIFIFSYGGKCSLLLSVDASHLIGIGLPWVSVLHEHRMWFLKSSQLFERPSVYGYIEFIFLCSFAFFHVIPADETETFFTDLIFVLPAYRRIHRHCTQEEHQKD